jgi:hypothetical protein
VPLTPLAVSRQIQALRMPISDPAHQLQANLPERRKVFDFIGGPSETRIRNLLIKSQPANTCF